MPGKRRRLPHRKRAKRSLRLQGDTVRIVQVFFHSNRYAGACTLRRCVADGKAFESLPVTKIPGEDAWVAVFPQMDIEAGTYLLTVQFEGRSVSQVVNVDYQFENVEPETVNDSVPRLINRAKKRGQFEILIGDAYSLEEGVLHQFGHMYPEKVLKLANDSQKGTKGESGFSAFMGILKTLHESAESLLGWVKFDNKYCRTIRNLGDLYKDIAERSDYVKLKKAVEELSLPDSSERLLVGTRLNLKEWQETVEKQTKPIQYLGYVVRWWGVSERVIDVFSRMTESADAEKEFYDFRRTAADELSQCARTLGVAGCWNRSMLMQLEMLKDKKDVSEAEEHLAMIALSWEVGTSFMGLVYPAGYVAQFGERAKSAKEALDKVRDGLTILDERALNSYYSTHLLSEARDWFSFAMGQAATTNTIGRLRRNLTEAYYRSISYLYAIHFEWRAKVFYGLLDLIGRCGSYERDPSGFSRNITKYRIEEYIETFCLNPFWVNRGYADGNWIDDYLLEESQRRNEVISPGVDRPVGRDSVKWEKVDFHSWFPVHYCEHSDVEELAKFLSLDYSGIEANDVLAAYWEFSLSGRGRSWRRIEDNQRIGTETPVRVVIILKNRLRSNIPVACQLERTDGADTKGPIYYTMTRPVREDDNVEGRFRGQKCAVVELTYSYGAGENRKRYRGIRPFGVYYPPDAEMEMRMHVEIGKEVDGYIPRRGIAENGLAWRTWFNIQKVMVTPLASRGEQQKRELERFQNNEFREEYK